MKFCSLVGGVDGVWNFLVIGEPFLQLKTAVDNSNSGEVVISKESYELVKDMCEGEPRGDDYLVKSVYEKSRLELPKLNEDSQKISYDPKLERCLRSYLLPVVQSRLDSHQKQYLAELRKVTVLFIKLSSISYVRSQELNVNSIHKVLRFMQSVIFRYEGMIPTFLVDDKGTILIATFGLPPFFHEDDAIRGLTAALQINNYLLKQGILNSIGVTTGKYSFL